MIEIAASIVGSFLLPLVKEGAATLRERLAKKAGDATADQLVTTAETLWDRIRGHASAGPEQSVVDTFAARPELMQSALEQIVSEQLAADPAFLAEAKALLEAPEPGGRTANQLMGDIVGYVDLRGATVSGGTVGGVIYTAPGGISAALSPEAPTPPPKSS